MAGFGRLLDAVWERLDKHVRAMPGTVLLHDATPLARYALAGLFLVEIKSHPGRAVNQGGTWLFHQDDHVRAIENPLHLTNRKCQELKSQLGAGRMS